MENLHSPFIIQEKIQQISSLKLCEFENFKDEVI